MRVFCALNCLLDLCRRALRRRLGSLTDMLSTAEALDHVLGVAAAEQSSPASRQAACWALGSMMAEDGPAVYQNLMPALAALLDRRNHDALSPTEIKIFQTPPGQWFAWLGQALFLSRHQWLVGPR